MSGALCSPSPAHGLNVLAAMSSELGPRLATPLSKDSEAVCETTAFHGVTFHQKKQKYLSRCALGVVAAVLSQVDWESTQTDSG